VPPEGIQAIVTRRAVTPFKTPAEVIALGVSMNRLMLGGNFIWTLRAAARLRRPDGTPSDTVRTASATVKMVDRARFQIPIHILRWYDDAWSQSAILPPGFAAPGAMSPQGSVPPQP
jgi:hypothetical protein